MEPLIITFLASLVYVFLKATQQLNVVYDRWALILPTSMLMAVCEVVNVVAAVATGYGVIIPIGLGGGIGCLFAMSLNRRLRGKTTDPQGD